MKVFETIDALENAFLTAGLTEGRYEVDGDNVVPLFPDDPDLIVKSCPARGDVEFLPENQDAQKQDEREVESDGAELEEPASAGEATPESEYSETSDSGPVDDCFGELNEAEIYGDETEGFIDFLHQPATFLTGEMWGTKDRRNTQDGDWKAVTMPWGAWINGGEGDKNRAAWGLSRHPEGKYKEGASIVLGSSVGGARKANAMDEMFSLGLDIDSGTQLDATVQKILNKGLLALIYTSHSHGKTGLELKRDDVIRKLQITGEPALSDVQEYLRSHCKSQYEESFISAVTIEDGKRLTVKGVQIVLSTPPLDKYRIIFPLAEAVKLIDLAPTQKECLEVWEDKITGMARVGLGVHFDVSCTDPSRLFFTARHAEGAEWGCMILRGEPLRFEDIPTMKKSDYAHSRGGAVGQQDRYFTESGVDLNLWFNENAENFEFADFLENMVPDKARGAIDGGGMSFECPFDYEHSDEGDADSTKFAVVNASGAKNGRGSAWCLGDACQGRKNAAYLHQMLDAGWFSEDQLFDEDGMHLMPPGEEVVTEGQSDSQEPASESKSDAAGEFEPVKDWLPKWKYVVTGGVIFLKDQGEEGKNRPICAAFDVVGRSSNADGTAGAGIIISFQNRNGEKVEKTISRPDIMANGLAVVSELADADMMIAGRGTKANDRLLDLLHDITPKRQVPVVPVPGWVRDRADRVSGFMCPTGEYIPAIDGVMRLHSDMIVKDRGTMGTFEGWQTGAHAAIDVKDNFYWPIGVAAGLTGPVMQLMQIDPVGLYFFGESGQGKSDAERLAVTAWTTAAPKRGLFRTGDATANAFEDGASMGTGTVSVIDEIGAMKRPQDLPSMLFGLSTGAGKDRKKGRGAGLAETAEFCPFTLMSSERPMRDVIESAGGEYKNGLGRRFPTIDTNAGVKVSDAVIAKTKLSETNFGHAGPMLVRWMIAKGHYENVKGLHERRNALTAMLVGKTNSNRLKEAGAVFALVALAGELAREAGIIDRDVFPAVKTAFEAFKRTDEGEGLESGDKIVNEFRTWVQGEMGHTIVAADALTDPDARPQYRSIVGWYTDDQIILMWDKIAKLPNGINGTRTGLFKSLTEIGAVEKSGCNNAHQSLPEDVETAGHATGARTVNRKVPNARLWRGKLEL